MEGSSVDKVVGQLGDQRLARMIVQSHRRVWRDARANAKWVFLLLGLILLWAFVSAAISANCGLTYSQPPITDGVTPTKTLSYWTAVYFTFINMTTVGFGEIYPISATARALAVVNAILGIAMFALLTGALVLSLSPSGKDEDTGNDPDLEGVGPHPAEPPRDGQLGELREADVLAWRRIGELVALVEAARELVPSESPAEELPPSSMESLHSLLHTHETRSLLAEALYARSRLAHAVYDLALKPRNSASSHLPKI